MKELRPAVGRLALSALRATGFGEEPDGPYWSIDPDRMSGRGLVMGAGTSLVVPLRLDRAVSLSGHVALLPHDWRDGRGAVRASVTATGADGHRCLLWSGHVRTADELGGPDGLEAACEIPPSTTALRLAVDFPGQPRPGFVGCAVWVEPQLVDASARPPTRPPRSAPGDAHASAGGPLVSVLMPVHDPPLAMLEEAIESVRSQTIGDWELCLVDDGSKDPEVVAMLERYAAADARLRLERREEAGGISSATNAGLALASGEYILLLDHDDALTPDALERVAARITQDPAVDMIYSDEDIVLDGRTVSRHFKPAWSPEHLSLLMYTCHVGVYRRTLAVDIGGFRSEFDGCQDYDFVLRFAERTDRVGHVPEVLYHWHAHATSTAGGDQAKPYAYMAQPRAIAEHLERSGVDAEVQFGPEPGLHRLVHRVDPAVRVSLVLGLGDEQGLAGSARSWARQPHRAWDVAIAAPQSALEACVDALVGAGVDGARISAVAADPAAGRAAWLAAAAEAAHGEHLLLMQDPVAGLTHDWVARLVGYSAQEQIGACGPIVLSAEGRIVEAGIALPEGVPMPLLHGLRGSHGAAVVMNVSAVSGVLATSANVYRALGGLDATYRDLELVDYCLRAEDAGLRVVAIPDVRLQLTRPARTTNDLPALWRVRESWSRRHSADPYYNPHYRTDRADFRHRVTLG